MRATSSVASRSRNLAQSDWRGATSSVRRWISANLSEEAVREKVTVARGLVSAGSEAQIDYGKPRRVPR